MRPTNEYIVSDPGDEVNAVFDYFNFHPSAAFVYNHEDEYEDYTEEE